MLRAPGHINGSPSPPAIQYRLTADQVLEDYLLETATGGSSGLADSMWAPKNERNTLVINARIKEAHDLLAAPRNCQLLSTYSYLSTAGGSLVSTSTMSSNRSPISGYGNVIGGDMISIYVPEGAFVAPSVRTEIAKLDHQLHLLAMAKAAASHIQVYNGATHGTSYVTPHERAIVTTNNDAGPAHKRLTANATNGVANSHPHIPAAPNANNGHKRVPPHMQAIADGKKKAAAKNETAKLAIPIEPVNPAANGSMDPNSLPPHKRHTVEAIVNNTSEPRNESVKLANRIESVKPAANNAIDPMNVPPHMRHTLNPATNSAIDPMSVPPHMRHTVVKAVGAPVTSDEKVSLIEKVSSIKSSPTKSKKSSEQEATEKFLQAMFAKDAIDRKKQEASIATRAEQKKAILEQQALLSRSDIQFRHVPSSLGPAAQSMKATTPWAIPAGKIVTNVKHKHFQVDVGAAGVGEFQAFLQNQREAPIVNGKTYHPNASSVQPKAKALAASRPTTPEQKENAVPVTKLSPKASDFTPGEAAPKPVIKLSPKAAPFTMKCEELAAPRPTTPEQKGNVAFVTKLTPKEGVFNPSIAAPKSTTELSAQATIFTPEVAAPKAIVKFSPEAAEFTPSASLSTNQSPALQKQENTKVKTQTEIFMDYMFAKAKCDKEAAIARASKSVMHLVAASKKPASGHSDDEKFFVIGVSRCEYDEEGELPGGWIWMNLPNSDGGPFYADMVNQTTSFDRPVSAVVKVVDGNREQPLVITAQQQAKPDQIAVEATIQQPAQTAPVADKATTVVPSSGVAPSNKEMTPANKGSQKAQVSQSEEGHWPRNCAPVSQHLTEDSVSEWGTNPSAEDVDRYEELISEDGIEDRPKENIRGTQGRAAAEELLNWDGKTWLPAPCIWEDRGNFDNGYLAEYIRNDWAPTVEGGPADFDLSTTPAFADGSATLNGTKLIAVIIQPPCSPNIEESENEEKRLKDTAKLLAEKWRATKKSYQQAYYQLQMDEAARHEEIAIAEPLPNPFSPAIDIYLRPAMASDAAGILEIYNYYVKNSIITEDGDAVNVADIKRMIDSLKSEKLPCIVAVRGRMPSSRMPSSPQAKLRCGQPKITLPQYESIAGFAFAATYGYGLNSLRTGCSKVTLDLKLYVHHNYTRKGVGRCLLDRLIQCCSFGYAAKDGYNWLNPKNDKVYQNGGASFYHQLVLQVPVIGGEKDPKVPQWQTDFLSKFWFTQSAILMGIGRSNGGATDGVAKFLDTIIFTKEAAPQKEFMANF